MLCVVCVLCVYDLQLTTNDSSVCPSVLPAPAWTACLQTSTAPRQAAPPMSSLFAFLSSTVSQTPALPWEDESFSVKNVPAQNPSNFKQKFRWPSGDDSDVRRWLSCCQHLSLDVPEMALQRHEEDGVPACRVSRASDTW